MLRDYFLLGDAVTGASHVANGIVCQDAYDFRSLMLPNGTYHLMAVADGHGTCPRADIGSKIAVQTFLNLAEELARRLAANPTEAASTSFLSDFQGPFARRLCESWRTQVELDDQNQGQPIGVKMYGTTLTGAVVTPTEAFLGRIGDSDAFVVVRPQNLSEMEANAPFNADSNLLGLETYSLSSTHAQKNWKVRRVSLEPLGKEEIVLIMLATDGFADSFEQPLNVVRTIAADTYRKGAIWLKSCLNSSLERFTKDGVGDDIAAILLFPKLPEPLTPLINDGSGVTTDNL